MTSSTEPTKDSTSASESPLTKEAFLADVASVLRVAQQELTDSSDLFDHGLDSIGTMRLVDQWRSSGIDIRFFDLVDDSTVDGWWRVLEAKTTGTS